jgi:hypothetical protein
MLIYDQTRNFGFALLHKHPCFHVRLIASALDILHNFNFLIVECRAAEELFEADKGGNKWEIIECCI